MRAKVTLSEIDLSTRVPSFPGVTGGIIIPATKGDIDKPVFVSNDRQLLKYFTPNETVSVGMSNSHYSALAFLEKSDKLWVMRAAKGAFHGGMVAVKKSSLESARSCPKTPCNIPDYLETATYAVGAKVIHLDKHYVCKTAITAGEVFAPAKWEEQTDTPDPATYVFNTDKRREVVSVTIPDNAITLWDLAGEGKHFKVSSAAAIDYLVWFNVTDGTNTQTAPTAAGTKIEVQVSKNDSIYAIANKLDTTLDPQHVRSEVVGATATFHLVAGEANDAVDVDSGCTITTVVQGANALTDECLLIYGANPGAWNNNISIKISTDIAVVKESDAFIIYVYKDGSLVEEWLCSRKSDKKDGYGKNIYINDVLNASSYVRGLNNVAVDSSILPKDITTAIKLGSGIDGSAVTDTEMIAALQKSFSNKSERSVTVLMDGGNATTAYHTALINLCDLSAGGRGDCVACLSVPYSDENAASYLTDVLAYRNTELNKSSSYAALYSPHVKIYDKFNDRELFVSPDGYAAAAISQTSSNYEMWYPPAGFKRGVVNVLDLRRRYSAGEMDQLYDAGVNPLRFAPGRGILIWGQKTLLSRPSSLDRVNVRLLLVQIEPAIEALLEDFLFELNDAASRSVAVTLIDSYMDNIKAKRGVTDYQVISDTSNNTDADIDAGRMIVDLLLRPTGSIEDIPLRVVLTSNALSFSEASQNL